jgi:uncharacterized protein (DUF2141 family)
MKTREVFKIRKLGTSAITTLFIVAPFFSTFAQAADNFSLQVKITQLRNSKGKVWVCLWSKNISGNFPDCDRNKASAKLSAPSTAPVVTFNNVPAGEYAVSFYQDENGDGTMTKNFAGMPKAAIGTSNNPPIGITSRPSFAKSHFLLAKSGAMTVEARYIF